MKGEREPQRHKEHEGVTVITYLFVTRGVKKEIKKMDKILLLC
jgi:hypothetical protein